MATDLRLDKVSQDRMSIHYIVLVCQQVSPTLGTGSGFPGQNGSRGIIEKAERGLVLGIVSGNWGFSPDRHPALCFSSSRLAVTESRNAK